MDLKWQVGCKKREVAILTQVVATFFFFFLRTTEKQ
jgi:hypothetical protein